MILSKLMMASIFGFSQAVQSISGINKLMQDTSLQFSPIAPQEDMPVHYLVLLLEPKHSSMFLTT